MYVNSIEKDDTLLPIFVRSHVNPSHAFPLSKFSVLPEKLCYGAEETAKNSLRHAVSDSYIVEANVSSLPVWILCLSWRRCFSQQKL